jgi:uncharacterized protein
MAERGDAVLIVGASTRGLAQSAALAGFRVQAVDAYGDRDLLACATTVALGRDLHQAWSAAAAVRAAADLRTEVVVYTSNLENHPAAVQRLAAGRQLWGNAPEVLRRVRDPFQVATALRERGLPAPASVATGDLAGAQRTWLVKPRRSGGGHGIRRWRPGERVPRSKYLQEQLDGIPGSITFVADGRRAVPLGLSLQLIGEQSLGGRAFRYCGSLLCGGPTLFPCEAALARGAADLAAAMTEAFGLVGVNGIDFVACEGMPWPVEVNPRYCASMELIEREHGTSIFGLHSDACRGRLPAQTPFTRHLARVPGKAIVYARNPLVVEPDPVWENGEVRDVPHSGERIARGRPVCTVFADGATAAGCRDALAAHAASVYDVATRKDRSVA